MMIQFCFTLIVLLCSLFIHEKFDFWVLMFVEHFNKMYPLAIFYAIFDV